MRSWITPFSCSIGPATDLGLDAALDWMTDAFKKHYGVSTRLEVTADGLRLTDLAVISLYRVVQEALTNVARHAKAMHVAVVLSIDGAHCYLSIKDDGVGLPKGRTLRPDAFGMRGMRERITQLGGDLEIDSRPGNGLTISAKVPLPRITADD